MLPRRFHPLLITAAIAPVFRNAPGGSFDPDLFMNSSIATPLATKVVGPTPGEYKGIIDDIKPPRVNADGSVVMDLVWLLDDEKQREKMGRKPTVKQAIWLDFENGQLATGEGKNVSLGRVREALGQNTGADWMPSQLKGGVAKIKVVPDINKNTGDDYGKVVAVSKL
jgi:hypothetical protein